MLFPLPSDDELYEALVARDPSFEGRAWVGVTTTGIFCRLTCTARKPKRENAVFFESIGACVESGFRPCKRCKPMSSAADADRNVRTLTDKLLSDPSRRWREADIVALGLDPSTVRRAFKRHFGTTFLDMARLLRIRTAAQSLAGGERVVDAQIAAGFESSSGFRAAFARILGTAPAGFTGDEHLKADWIDTPLGAMIAVADSQALHLLEFFDRKALPGELAKLKRLVNGSMGVGRLAPTERIAAELQRYFDGDPGPFETPLALHGSPFTRSVWDALRRIPPGETRSYGAIAAQIGKPSAVRAVARANGANTLALIVPCHRVIGADGSLTGYGGGVWRKQWLLDHERRHAGPDQMEKQQAPDEPVRSRTAI